NGSNAANVRGEDGFRVELYVLAALLGCRRYRLALGIDAAGGDAAIEYAEIVEVDRGIFTGPGAKIFLQFPAAFGQILAAQSGVHAAIDGPVEGVANHCTLGVRGAEVGNQKTALAPQALDRRRNIREL